MTAYVQAVTLLARRELSVRQLRTRLLERQHPPDEVEAAIARLLEERALDDERVARAYARTAGQVKGRGRLRVTRELQDMGISREVAVAAVAEVFADADERTLIARAVQKKLRGRKPATVQERARLYQFLMRQGFTPAAVADAMRSLGRPDD
jgi:regulatory protein